MEFGTNTYFKTIGEINDVYREMIMIVKAKKVFHDKVCPMILAKTKDEFKKARKRLSDKYLNYTQKPHPHKYCGSSKKPLPTLREIITRERILEFEHYTETLNMFMCSKCRECNIESKAVTDKLMY